MKKLQPSVTVAILRGERTEAMKAVRRIYGDRGGVPELVCNYFRNPAATIVTAHVNHVIIEYDI